MESKSHQCECGKVFNHRQSLLRHAKECKPVYIATAEPLNCDLHKQIINLQLELKQKDMELQKKEIEYAYQLQLKEMEYKLKIQEFISQYTMQNQLQQQPQNQLQTHPPVSINAINTNETNKKEHKSFCLKEYLNNTKPILISEFKEQFTACIEHYTTILSNRNFEDGMSRNIINYIKKYEQNQLPIVISNSQNARFKMYLYKQDPETKVNKWYKYEGVDAIDEIENIIQFFSCRLLKYKTSIFNAAYPQENDNDTNLVKNLSILSALANSGQYKEKIFNLIKDYFIINKTNDD